MKRIIVAGIGCVMGILPLQAKRHIVMEKELEPMAQAYCNETPTPLNETLQREAPELWAMWGNFAWGETRQSAGKTIGERTQWLSHLAVLIGCGGIDAYGDVLDGALAHGLTGDEVRETVYQAVAYMGMGRAYPFVRKTHEILTRRGIALTAQTYRPKGRRERGTEAQVGCFGEGMRDFWQSGPEDSRHINLWLAENCFGDYYTREGLSLQDRELVTFCLLAAQGGCEPQLKGHIRGNYHVGNGKDVLIAVLSGNIAWIGYPRTLNALQCIREVSE